MVSGAKSCRANAQWLGAKFYKKYSPDKREAVIQKAAVSKDKKIVLTRESASGENNAKKWADKNINMKNVYYIILCYRSNNVYNHREKNVQNDQEERTVFNFEMLIVKKRHKNLSLKGPT